MAKNAFKVDVIAVGNEEIIKNTAKDEDISLDGIEIVHADEVINMEDDATCVVKDKKNSSMAKGLSLLADGMGDAFVSAGNTGALLAGATLIVRRIKGIRRAAIGSVLPLLNPVMLLDSGANIEVDEKMLEQFAVMGSTYMEKIYGVSSARVGLLNNGTETTKGTPLYKSANVRLSASQNINFVGNVEGKEVPLGCCDVLVCDGFTGNVFLKTVEGMGKFFMKTLKDVLYESLFTKFAALPLKRKVVGLKKRFDASEHGGAPLLGISKPVFKAHGSSDARAVMNAVRQAKNFVETNVIEDISARIAVINDCEENGR